MKLNKRALVKTGLGIILGGVAGFLLSAVYVHFGST